MKSREKTRQISENWSQQLEHKQVPKRGADPRVRKGRRSLLACHTGCICSIDTTCNSVKVKFGILKGHKIGGKSDWLGSHCNLSRVRMPFNIHKRSNSYC